MSSAESLAVQYVQFVGGLAGLLLYAVPITTIVAIVRRRNNRPGASLFFPVAVLVCWSGFVVYEIRDMVSGSGFYGENGPSPQLAALACTAIFAGLLIVHVALIKTSSEW